MNLMKDFFIIKNSKFLDGITFSDMTYITNIENNNEEN